MARLVAFGKDAAHALSELDTVDLEALQLAREWGYQNGHKERGWTFERCTRTDCGGAIVSGWGFDGCMLCGRSGLTEFPRSPVNGSGRRKHGPRWGKEAL